MIHHEVSPKARGRNSNSQSAYRKRDGRVPADFSFDCLLVQRGKIRAIQIGGRWRIKKSSLDRDILRQDEQGHPTVLVVDDELGLPDLFRTLLKQIGFGRVAACTAKEALISFRNQKFDLVFLDLQLHEAPGDQVHKTAKQIYPVPKVIVITGYPDSKILDRILQFSPVTVLKTPLQVEQQLIRR